MKHEKKGPSVAIVAMGASSQEWFARHYRHGSEATYKHQLQDTIGSAISTYNVTEDHVDRISYAIDEIAREQAIKDRGPQYDEVWGISHMGGELRELDMVFAMDDMRLKGSHWPRAVARDVPLMTSTVYPEFPRAVEYPLGDVIEDLGLVYLKNTVSYALAYAIHMKYERVGVFGVDFFYENSKLTERGMGCFMFYAGVAHDRGIQLDIARNSATMDNDKPNTLYGYAEQPVIHLSDGDASFDGNTWVRQGVRGGVPETGGETAGEPVQASLRPLEEAGGDERALLVADGLPQCREGQPGEMLGSGQQGREIRNGSGGSGDTCYRTLPGVVGGTPI